MIFLFALTVYYQKFHLNLSDRSFACKIQHFMEVEVIWKKKKKKYLFEIKLDYFSIDIFIALYNLFLYLFSCDIFIWLKEREVVCAKKGRIQLKLPEKLT